MASIQPLPFASLLKRLRLEAGLTQEGLAERARLSARAISQLERGARQNPRKDTLALLAQALQLSEAVRARFYDAARVSASLHSASAASTVQCSASNGVLRAPQPTGMHVSSWPPFIGRTGERALLERYLTRPHGSHTQPLLALAGEPGIGKSRLLQEAVHSAAATDWTVLSGGCHRKSGQEPYAPLVGALARFLAQRTPVQQRMDLQGCSWLVRLLPELCETALVPAPSWTATDVQDRRLMFGAVARFLANVAGPAGTLLVMDDLQWAGEDALDLLASLVRLESDAPIRVLAAYRDSEVQTCDPLGTLLADLSREDLSIEVQLTPLDTAEARQLLGHVLRMTDVGWSDAPIPDHVQEQVVRRAGGVPFFLISCTELLRAEARPGQLADGWSSVPRNAGQSIRQRVAMLSDGARELLGVAAIAGRETPRWLLVEVARGLGYSREVVIAALDTACHARLLAETDGGRYQFTHDLIREVVAADASGIRRAALHLCVAQALERSIGEPSAELLAYHYARSDDQQNAVIWLERAGDKAFGMHANADAAEYFGELATHLDAAVRPADTARAHEKWGTALRLLGRGEEAFAALSRADALYRQVGDVHGRARSMTQVATRGIASTALERLPLVQSVLDQLEQEGASLELAQLYERQAALLRAIYRDDEALAAADRAIHFARACGDERVLIHAQVRRGTVLLSIGRIEDGQRVMQQQIVTAEALGDMGSMSSALSLAIICTALAWTHKGEFSTALAMANQAVELTKQVGDLAQQAFTTGLFGWSAFDLGAWDEARACLEEVIARCRQAGAAVLSDAGYALAVLGTLSMARGERDAAVEYLEESIGRSQTYDPNDAWLAQCTLSECDLLEGRPTLALDRLLSLLRPQSHHAAFAPYFLSLLSWAYADLGNYAAAHQTCTDAIGRAQSLGFRLALIEGQRAQALVAIRQARWSASRRILEEGLALVRAMSYPYMEAKLLYTYGLLEQMAGRLARARERLQAALTICERLGERLYRAHIERALGNLEAACAS